MKLGSSVSVRTIHFYKKKKKKKETRVRDSTKNLSTCDTSYTVCLYALTRLLRVTSSCSQRASQTTTNQMEILAQRPINRYGMRKYDNATVHYSREGAKIQNEK